MLTNADLIILTAAVYLGGSLTKFFTALSQDIILPLIAPITAAQKDLSAFTIQLGSVQLKIGEFLVELVNLIISLFLVVTVVGIIKSYVLPAVGGKRAVAVLNA